MHFNEWDVEEARDRYRDHPILGPATKTLLNLVVWTNENSDGWAYWPKPGRAAKNLQELIGSRRTYIEDPDREDVTVEAYRKALRPIKAFRTRKNATFTIEEAS